MTGRRRSRKRFDSLNKFNERAFLISYSNSNSTAEAHIDHPVDEVVNQSNGCQDECKYVNSMSRDSTNDSSKKSNFNLNAETDSLEQHMVNVNDSLRRHSN